MDDKRPNYLVKITGNDWDNDGEPVCVDTEDECRGVLAFIVDDDSMLARMYGKCSVVDLVSVIYLLKAEFGTEAYDTAERAASMLIEGEKNAAETDRECAELHGVHAEEPRVPERL